MCARVKTATAMQILALRQLSWISWHQPSVTLPVLATPARSVAVQPLGLFWWQNVSKGGPGLEKNVSERSHLTIWIVKD